MGSTSLIRLSILQSVEHQNVRSMKKKNENLNWEDCRRMEFTQNSQEQTCKKFTPFGGGSRCCPGSELAKVEVAFFLHHLVRSFRWRTQDDQDQPMAFPYVEFPRGLLLNVEPLMTDHALKKTIWIPYNPLMWEA